MRDGSRDIENLDVCNGLPHSLGMAGDAHGFEVAAHILESMIGNGGQIDVRLSAISKRLRAFHLTGKGDLITAAIIVESEAKKSSLADADILFSAAAMIRSVTR